MRKGSKRFNPWRNDTENTHKPFYAQALVNTPNPKLYVVTDRAGRVIFTTDDGGKAWDAMNTLPTARAYGSGDEGDDRVFGRRGPQTAASESEAA